MIGLEKVHTRAMASEPAPAQSRNDRAWNFSSEKRRDRSVWYLLYLNNERIIDLPFIINHIIIYQRMSAEAATTQENPYSIVVARTVMPKM